MKKSELFRLATEKNQLRRELGLPLLDIRTEMKNENNREKIAEFTQACVKHINVFYEYYKASRQDHLDKIGFDLHKNAKGRNVLKSEAYMHFKEYLSNIGFEEPEV